MLNSKQAGLMGHPPHIQIIRPVVRCDVCSNVVFDGEVIKARVIKVLEIGAQAKCLICKTWVAVPLTYRD